MNAPAAITAVSEYSEAELRDAYRRCAIRNMTFEQAMSVQTFAIAIKNMAKCIARRKAKLAEQQHLDRKRAQANDMDLFDL